MTHTHDEHQGHHHHHGLPKHAPNLNSAFIIGITLNSFFVVIEIFYGVYANSLSLIADAGHNLGDVLSLVLAWGAATLSQRRPSLEYSYGYKSSSILAALANAAFLWVAVGAIMWEAFLRLQSPTDVSTQPMIVVAACGIVINGLTAWMFAAGRHHDLNLRGAFLHMASDALISAGVVISGVLIAWTGALWIDSVSSLLIGLAIAFGSWTLFRDAIKMALQAVPSGVDASKVRAFLLKQKGVSRIHDLHIWPISTTETAMTVHLVIPQGHPGDEFLHHLAHELEHNFHIAHPTIQIETGDQSHLCRLEPDEIV